jgi:CheY-like chemotaxis protein
MSDGSIFRFSTAASPSIGVSASAFHHTALDADASARLAAMDRASTEDEQAEDTQASANRDNSLSSAAESSNSKSNDSIDLSDHSQPEQKVPSQAQSQTEDEVIATLIAESAATQDAAASPDAAPNTPEIDSTDPLAILAQTIENAPSQDSVNAAPEVELAQIEFHQPAISEESAAEITGIFAAAAAASENINHQPLASESLVEESSVIEAAIDESILNSASEAAAPELLEVAPIFDASGELQSCADDYTPPAPFEIHVPDALTAEETPLIADAEELDAQNPTECHAENISATAADTTHLSETFDLDSICAPTEAEQIIEHAIAQEDAVAEMSAAAEEFVAEQIAAETGSSAASTDGSPSVASADALLATTVPSSIANAAQALHAEPAEDRRRKRRALISSPIRVRGIHVTTSGPDEITTTVDVSRYGILFHTVLDTYQRGMDVAVVFPYHKSATGAQAEQFGRVVRLQELPDGRQAVAIALGVGVGEHLVDSNGRQLTKNEPVQLSNSSAPQVKRPMVLAIDSDTMLRDTLKMYLQNEGYEVIAVSTATDAREVLNMFMPAMIVAEIEGEGDLLPGLDLCAHVKSSPSLRHLPVVLTSRSAYPSDYSNAHSLGAVVCMAKPYKMERLGHIVRLLAPLPEHLQPACTPRPPDLTRGFGRDSHVTQRDSNGSRKGAKKSNTNGNGKNRFKFPSFR